MVFVNSVFNRLFQWPRPLWATFLTRDFYTRLAPIEGAPQALAGRAMSVSGTPEIGLAREVASEKNNKL